MKKRIIICPKCQTLNKLPVEIPEDKNPKCGKCSEILDKSTYVFNANSEILKKSIKNSEHPLIVDVWGPHCGPCLSFAPTFEQFSQKYPSVLCLKVNSQEEGETASALGVRSIPTLIIYHKNQEISRRSGALGIIELESWFHSLSLLDEEG